MATVLGLNSVAHSDSMDLRSGWREAGAVGEDGREVTEVRLPTTRGQC